MTTALQRDGLCAVSVDHYARRVAIQAEIGRTIDLHAMAVDPALLNLTDAEHVRELTIALGQLAAMGTAGDQHALLIELASRAQGWLEAIALEQAA